MKHNYLLNAEKIKMMCQNRGVTIRDMARSQNIEIKRMENLIYRQKQKRPTYAKWHEVKRIADFFKSIPESIAEEIYPSSDNQIYKNWVSLPKKEIDERNHFTEGMLDYRIENGNVVMYTQKYMSIEDIVKKVKQVNG